MIYFRKPLEGIDRPQMEADVTIVGGGPAGMACALRLAQLIDQHNRLFPNRQVSKENIYVLEKAREVGQHNLSGAVLDPRGMDELLPGWRDEAPLEAVAKRLDKGSGRGEGDGEVNLIVMLNAGAEVEVKLPGRYKVSPQIAGAIKAVPGVVEVRAV